MAVASEPVQQSKRSVNRISKILDMSVNVLFVMLILFTIFFIFYVVNARKNGGQPSFDGFHIYNIASGSMKPKIPIGSMVITKSINTSSIKKGDIISFKSNNIVISHRVYDIYTQSDGEKIVLTKGDANKSVDPDIVLQNQIIGKVILHIPLLGFVLNYVTTKLGIIVCIVIPMFLIVIYDTARFFIELNSYLKVREARPD
jgi:signal peptidase